MRRRAKRRSSDPPILGLGRKHARRSSGQAPFSPDLTSHKSHRRHTRRVKLLRSGFGGADKKRADGSVDWRRGESGGRSLVEERSPAVGGGQERMGRVEGTAARKGIEFRLRRDPQRANAKWENPSARLGSCPRNIAGRKPKEETSRLFPSFSPGYLFGHLHPLPSPLFPKPWPQSLPAGSSTTPTTPSRRHHPP